MGKPRSRERAKALSSEAGTGSREENASKAKAFSSEVGTGSREENASKQGARRGRRSIVELTAAASRAAEDGLLAPGLIAAAEKPMPARAERPRRVSDAGEEDARKTPPVGNAPDPASGEKTSRRAPGTCELAASDSSAEMAVKIAKEVQGSALDDIRGGLSAALDYALDLATRRAPSGAASQDRDRAGPDAAKAAAIGAVADYRAEALELMKANVAATMDYARQLMAAKTSAEFVALSSTHARKQCELMLQQTRALRALARTVTKSGAE